MFWYKLTHFDGLALYIFDFLTKKHLYYSYVNIGQCNRWPNKGIRNVYPCISVQHHVLPYLTMYDSYLKLIGRMTNVWKRMSTFVDFTSCMVVYTDSYDRTHSLTVLDNRLYYYTRTWHPYRFCLKFYKPCTAFTNTLE